MGGVLVAGGAGFIGSNLCEKLLFEGYRVVCLDNLITGDKKNIEKFLNNSNFEFIELDITNPILNSQLSIRQLTDNFQFIFHLASPASPNKKSKKSYINYPIETLLANSVGTYSLLELTKKNNAKFLYASSSEIYGDPAINPQVETYFGNVNSTGVRSVYDEGKRFGEAMTMAYFRKHGMDIRIIRIFNTYGPGMQIDDGRVVSNFINQALQNNPIAVYGDGTQTRSFCYVDDTVEGLKRAMFLDKTNGEVINVGNPNEMNILDLAKLIKDMRNSSSEIIFEELPDDDPTRRRPDITKAEKLLNWKPTVSLEEGLKKTIDYFSKL